MHTLIKHFGPAFAASAGINTMGIAIGGSNDWWINLVAGLLSVLVAALLGKAAKKG